MGLRETDDNAVRLDTTAAAAAALPRAEPTRSRGGRTRDPTSLADRTGSPRVRAGGKFLYRGEDKVYLRGFTYGTFSPDEDGGELHDPDRVERDFELMAAQGANAVRTYTVPPRWLLDAAGHHGLMVMVGIPWEQHVAFLDIRGARARSWTVFAPVRGCAGHSAVLCFAVGNEIPPSIVRWHGRRRIERFLERLYRAAKRRTRTRC